MTIIVLADVDGSIQNGITGPEYTIPPKITFPTSNRSTFEDVKNEIFRGLGYTEDDYIISIQARFDIGAPGPHYFQLIPIYEERGWKMIFEKTQTRASWHIMELYVDCKPAQVVLSQITESSRQTERNDTNVYLQHRTIHPAQVASQEDDYVGEETDLAEDRIEQDDDREHDADGSTDHSTDDEHPEPQPVVHSINSFPFMHATGKNPIKAFSDIYVLKETIADESFFGHKKQFDSPLARGKTFDSKEHLKIAIGEFHIEKNAEVKYSTSSKSKIVAECTDNSCTWRLYATPTGIDCFLFHRCIISLNIQLIGNYQELPALWTQHCRSDVPLFVIICFIASCAQIL
ncbi:hypothetical protein OsI_25468 [Oryza sativa Indica Group]|uniref:Transposase MuDR plant domain-containing protein n=1 Tax=Oryza sativa subsp. indica TaxID=39946 RepID=A2YJR4_ORYSI|nr:hypothetical protein OsI_25468 [Oryza sativa Indica Group]